jgi:predicted AAA+ superfamily ATPase
MMPMKKMAIVIIVILVFFAIAFGFVLWRKSTEEQKIADVKAFIDIFRYITIHEGREFDYLAVAKELKLSEDELVSSLSALERAGTSKVTPRYLARKPIVISASDRKWYFHRGTLPHTEVPVPSTLPDR